MTSTRDELRIRLEGRLELIEEAVETHRRANRALESRDWVNEPSWWPSAIEREEAKPALEELARVAPEHELLSTLEREREKLHQRALWRLSKLGITEQPEREGVVGALGRLRVARPLIDGRMGPFAHGDRFHWVTQFFIALLVAVLCIPITLGLSRSLCLISSSLALISPLVLKLLRVWLARGTRFRVTEGSITLAADEAHPIPLSDVKADIFVSRGRWRVTWHLPHRDIMGSAVSETEASALRALLGKRARTW